MSWNVNGIRAVMKKDFLDIMRAEQPDILCLQETKAFFHQMPKEMQLLEFPDVCWHTGERAGYAGTAVLSNGKWVRHENTFEHSVKFHEHGRVTEVELPDQVLLLNCYFPNGGARANGQEMLTYKLWFYDDMAEYLKLKQSQWYEIIITGDFNICHTEIDIARPKENQNSIGFLPVERQRIGDFMEECGLTDVYRHFHPDRLDEYTWWSYRSAARARNVWRRIDYFMVSEGLLDKVTAFRHRQDIMWSDHCPVEMEIDL